jgi:hypothetical protein
MGSALSQGVLPLSESCGMKQKVVWMVRSVAEGTEGES